MVTVIFEITVKERNNPELMIKKPGHLHVSKSPYWHEFISVNKCNLLLVRIYNTAAICIIGVFMIVRCQKWESSLYDKTLML